MNVIAMNYMLVTALCCLSQLALAKPLAPGPVDTLHGSRGPLSSKHLSLEKESDDIKIVKDEITGFDFYEEDLFDDVKEEWSYYEQLQFKLKNIETNTFKKLYRGEICMDFQPPKPEQEAELAELLETQQKAKSGKKAADLQQYATKSLVERASSLEEVVVLGTIGFVIGAVSLAISVGGMISSWFGGKKKEAGDKFILDESVKSLIEELDLTQSSLEGHQRKYTRWSEDGGVESDWVLADHFTKVLRKCKDKVEESRQALCELADANKGNAQQAVEWQNNCAPYSATLPASSKSLSLETVTPRGVTARKSLSLEKKEQFGVCCIILGLVIGGAVAAGAGTATAVAVSQGKKEPEAKSKPPSVMCHAHVFQSLASKLFRLRQEIATLMNDLPGPKK